MLLGDCACAVTHGDNAALMIGVEIALARGAGARVHHQIFSNARAMDIAAQEGAA
ncbi:MAG: hypothetical protein L3J58_02440 [Emcibacter sp.]|nr:hypothetical protein [Emcibacter sp.]